jgi:hypothetical protein
MFTWTPFRIDATPKDISFRYGWSLVGLRRLLSYSGSVPEAF